MQKKSKELGTATYSPALQAKLVVKRPAASRLLHWSFMIICCNYCIHSIDGIRNVFAADVRRKAVSEEPEPSRGIWAEFASRVYACCK